MIYRLTDVGFTYPESANTLLAHFDWQINNHERWALIGPSGCGKTTLLYLLAGLKKPTQGTVICQGKPAAAPMDGVSFIQQHYGLFRWKTVRKNLALPLILKKVPRKKIAEKVAREINRLGLEGLENKFPSQLSGGQCQRVAIGRALIDEPSVLLMDEPFSALDALTRETLQEEVLQLSQESGVTLVLVTHSIEEAVYICDHLLVYGKDGDTPVVVDNTATPKERYATAFVAQCAYVKQLLEGGTAQ
ncbi:MAG: ATP-binding cassette domain-containing protein [Peptococcaceae bacterium]|nr:ATP-binding cassette domain-containing protein [Peptococcaceae bacterium]